MKKMMFFEIKKLYDKKLLVVFVVLLFFNMVHIISESSEVRSDSYRGKRLIINEVEGKITQDKVDFLLDGYNKNSALVAAGEYDTEERDPNTYTGYVFGDMNMFNEIYTDLKRVYEYSNDMETRIKILDENIERDPGLSSEAHFIKSDIGDRAITSYFDTTGIQKYFDYSDSILFILIMHILVLGNYLFYDRSHDMEAMIHTTQNGRSKLRMSRYITSMGFVVLSTLTILLMDLILFYVLYKIKGLGNPIYSLTAFNLTYMNLPVYTYVILQIIIKLLVSVFLGTLMINIVDKFRNKYLSVLFSFGLSFGTWLILFRSTSPLSIQRLSQFFTNLFVASVYIQKLHILVASIFLLFFILSLSYLKRGKKVR